MSSNSMVNRATVRDSNGDRISDLPDGIIENILSRLPIQETVRTSILSKPWRYKWLTIPDLVFDWNFEELLYGNYKPVSIVNQVLVQHEGPIIKFKFLCEATTVDGSIIPMWMKLLSYHPIEEFKLIQEPEGDLEQVPKHLLPKHLFSFDCLKHLNLCSVAIRLPPVFKGFSRLLTLILDTIDIDSKDFNMFVSKCPVLEVFWLFNYHYEAINLVIDAPNLKAFKFHGKFKSFVSENMNIEEISIWPLNTGDNVGGGDDLPPVDGSNLINFFGQLPSVRKLEFGGNFLKFLAKGVGPDMLPNYLNHLTTLEFSCFDFGAMDHVTCLLCLIRSSPNLQSLQIGDPSYDGTIHNSMEGPIIEYLKAQETCEVSLGHNIKNITMNWFRGLKAEMAFVKVMLLKSMLLRKLKIKFPPLAPKEVSQVKIALAGFRRASSEAVVEYLDMSFTA